MASSRTPINYKELLLSAGIFLLGLVVVYVALISLIQPAKYDIRSGDVAEMTITATKDVVDEITTQRREQEERDKVQPERKIDLSISESAMQRVDELFAVIDAGRVEFESYRKVRVDNSLLSNPGTPLRTEDVKPDASHVSKLRNAIMAVLSPDAVAADSAENVGKISDAQIISVLTASATELATFRGTVTDMLNMVFADGLLESEMEAVIAQLRYRINTELYAVPYSLQSFAGVIFAYTLAPNEFIDDATTEMKREEAAEAVEPVVYKKGQNIVREGEVIQENQVAMLEALGLLKESNRPDLAMYIGMGIIVLLLGFAACLSLWDSEYDGGIKPKRALLLVTALMIELVASLAMREINAYLMPIHFLVMIVSVLLSPHVALSMNLLVGVMMGVLAAGTDGAFSVSTLEVLLVSQIGGIVAAMSLRKVQRRTTLLLGGLYTALANAAVMTGIGLMTNLDLSVTLKNTGYVVLSALISSVLAVGVLPLLESAFSIMTQQKLLELSNPNQSLLRMLQLEAPGTYHHALLVANLAEAAADAIGANALLCRVGAYYHDIGKVKRPLYFKENQLDDNNPHDSMTPQMSASVLADHVRNGRAMGEKEKLPRPIIDIIQQHHGTTTMAYFLYRAQQDAEETGMEVSPDDYRYAGPTPQSKEAAIIFLADSVEAAVRSLKNHTNESIQGMIKKLINDRMQDGQLADVPMTLADFHQLELAFMRVLSGIYHTRVEYPEMKKAQ